MDKLKLFFMVVAFWIFAYLITINNAKSDKDYDERGIEVPATIYEVTPGVRRGHESYTCFYLDEKGERVYAELILNQFDGKVGDVVIGRYLPESPDKVYCKPDAFFMLGFQIVVVGLAIILTVFFVLTTFGGKAEKQETNTDYISWDNTYTSNSIQEPEYDDYEQEDNGEQEPWSKKPSNENGESSTGLKLKL